jgi:hypothetical protein
LVIAIILFFIFKKKKKKDGEGDDLENNKTPPSSKEVDAGSAYVPDDQTEIFDNKLDEDENKNEKCSVEKEKDGCVWEEVLVSALLFVLVFSCMMDVCDVLFYSCIFI